jgi:hypothetical protein
VLFAVPTYSLGPVRLSSCSTIEATLEFSCGFIAWKPDVFTWVQAVPVPLYSHTWQPSVELLVPANSFGPEP